MRKLTQYELLERLKSFPNIKIIRLDENFNLNSSGEFIDLNCDCKKSFNTSLREILYRNACCKNRECSIKRAIKKQKWSEEKWLDRLYEVHGHDFTPLEKYNGALTTISFKCNRCEYIFRNKPSKVLLGQGCPKCAGKIYTQDDWERELYEITKGEYISVSEYISAHTYTKIKHTTCGNVFECTPGHFKHDGQRCPNCRKIENSYGEKIISNFLKKYNIPFIKQKYFIDCKNEKPLPFDFEINNELLIEFDGEQHFRPVDIFKDKFNTPEEAFEDRKYWDNHKNNYCISNKIPLIRIPYQLRDEYLIEENLEILFGFKEGQLDERINIVYGGGRYDLRRENIE